MDNDSLVEGLIQAGTACPFLSECKFKIHSCPSIETPKFNNFSCAAARLHLTIKTNNIPPKFFLRKIVEKE